MIEDYRIETDYAVFRIKATDGIVTFTSPIAKWALRKKIGDVLAYYRRKNARIDKWI